MDPSYRFCATPGCDVAWFGEATGARIPVGASRVRIGKKETRADRTLCYCFGFSAAGVAEEVADTGREGRRRPVQVRQLAEAGQRELESPEEPRAEQERIAKPRCPPSTSAYKLASHCVIRSLLWCLDDQSVRPEAGS